MHHNHHLSIMILSTLYKKGELNAYLKHLYQ